jgi:hypothetical protein
MWVSRLCNIASTTTTCSASIRINAYYDAMCSRLEARKAVYTAPTYRARARALFALLRQGSYGRSAGGHFSWNDFLLDFYLAAPLGPRLRRLLRK